MFILHAHGLVVPHTLLAADTARPLLHPSFEPIVLLTHRRDHVFQVLVLSLEIINLLLVALPLPTTGRRCSRVVSRVLTRVLHIVVVRMIAVSSPGVVVGPTLGGDGSEAGPAGDRSWSP